MKKITLSTKERESIIQAVEEAETKTSGEISTAVIKESSDYIFYELAFCVAMGLLTALLLVAFGPAWQQFWFSLHWDMQAWQLQAFSFLMVFLVMGLSFPIANSPFIDRLIVPRKAMAQQVREKAYLHFLQSGQTETEGRCAILLFISLNERRVELVADCGINAKIEDSRWQEILNRLVGEIRKNRLSKGLVQAISECGEILQKEFPLKGRKKDQLSNSIQILEV